MKQGIKLWLILVILLHIGTTLAELKDPRMRNENLSNTELKVDVSREGELYKYVYSINNTTSNLGIIDNLMIDVSCDIDFGKVEIPVTVERKGHLGNSSKDGKHVPVEVFAGYGTSNDYGVTRGNYALWGLYLLPGKQVTNLWLLSTAPPGQRQYIIEPFMETDALWGWDYSNVEENTPDIPWIEDFAISGNVIGPACTLDSPEQKLYLGTGLEPFNINGLLAYSEPEQDPIYLNKANSVARITVHYSASIQKNSFKAKLNGEDITDRFKPTPGTKETVTISGPWKKMNRLKLSVLGVTDGRVKGVSQDKRPEQSLDTPAQTRAARKFDEFKSKDTDTFHIWIK